jgi:hypothetical protein
MKLNTDVKVTFNPKSKVRKMESHDVLLPCRSAHLQWSPPQAGDVVSSSTLAKGGESMHALIL